MFYMANKISKISIDILRGIALVGIVAVAAGSPNFWVGVYKNLGRHNNRFRKDYTQKQVGKTLSNLRKSGMIILREQNGKFLVEVGEKGKRKIKEITLTKLKDKKPKDWDGLWRVIIFDIPEHNKIGREALRGKMKELGFYQLQKSVWVFPYDCEKEIELLAELFDIFPYINFLEVKRIKDDLAPRQHFGLDR